MSKDIVKLVNPELDIISTLESAGDYSLVVARTVLVKDMPPKSCYMVVNNVTGVVEVENPIYVNARGMMMSLDEAVRDIKAKEAAVNRKRFDSLLADGPDDPKKRN